jgi:hypothetical protein
MRRWISGILGGLFVLAVIIGVGYYGNYLWNQGTIRNLFSRGTAADHLVLDRSDSEIRLPVVQPSTLRSELPQVQLLEVSAAQQSPTLPVGEKTMTIDKLIVREVVVDKQTVENSHVKKKDVDQEQVKCQKVDHSQVEYQDVDYSHIKRQDVDDQYVNRQHINKRRIVGGGAVARVATKAPCPSGVCSEYAWNPADPRQPAPGTVSPRQF